jgi:8-oxo-dGTP diphosphatase
MIDALYRLAYRSAYRMARVYWTLFNPLHHGALVALWHEGKILLIRNSYVDYFSLPGGYVRRGEQPRDAAVRELREEVSLSVDPEQLELRVDETNDWEGRQDHVVIFELCVTDPPRIQVDNREVIAAEFVSPEDALSRRLFPPLRRLVEQHAASARAAGSSGEPERPAT